MAIINQYRIRLLIDWPMHIRAIYRMLYEGMEWAGAHLPLAYQTKQNSAYQSS